MNILHPDIQKFIEQMRALRAVGCLIVPASAFENLMAMLKKADVIIGPTPYNDRVTYYCVHPNSALDTVTPPAVLIVLDEEYEGDDQWRERVRNVAGYFMRVKD